MAAVQEVNYHNSSVLNTDGNESGDFTAYYAFSKKGLSLLSDETGLSGFLEYRKLDGTWRPFLFQTIDFQLVVYRVHLAYQITVMSTDIRKATDISLAVDDEEDPNNTRLLKLGINDTVITLRAVSHNAAKYWVEGLKTLQEGKKLEIVGDRPTMESEEDIFREIDQLAGVREWKPPPSQSPTVCLDFCHPFLTQENYASHFATAADDAGGSTSKIPMTTSKTDTTVPTSQSTSILKNFATARAPILGCCDVS